MYQNSLIQTVHDKNTIRFIQHEVWSLVQSDLTPFATQDWNYEVSINDVLFNKQEVHVIPTKQKHWLSSLWLKSSVNFSRKMFVTIVKPHSGSL